MYDSEVINRCSFSPIGFNNTYEEVKETILDGFTYKARSILVSPMHVEILAEMAKEYGNSYTRIGMIDNYPYGGFTTEYKVILANHALKYGMDEICLGPNISAFLSGDLDRFKSDIAAVQEVISGKMEMSVITWAVRIPLEKLEQMLNILLKMGIHRIKSSPGVRFGDMQLEHIEFIHRRFGTDIEIEVAGRVRSREKMEAMAQAGATTFHLGSWRRISGIGQDMSFNWDTKRNEYGEYKDRF